MEMNEADKAQHLMDQRAALGMNPTWQQMRGASKDEFATALEMLDLSQAAAARYLGVSARQVARWLEGKSRVPTSVCLLFEFMIYYNIKPIVPKRVPGAY